jgi:peptide-methionine (S)-S-oxide reductase
MKALAIAMLLFVAAISGRCSLNQQNHSPMQTNAGKCGIDSATFGTGCFWCSEAIFRDLRGVLKVIPGYSGGNVKNPSYQDVCTGTTGHAEVCQVIYDTEKITFEELLEVFFLIHDPTTLNRQGNDVGTQYRSVIFVHNASQKEIALEYKKMLNKSGEYKTPLVTEINPITNFYKAEDYHQNYYNLNKEAPYCQIVIGPKLAKFRKVFKDKVKDSIPLP